MTVIAAVLALASAGGHAVWNIRLKASGDPLRLSAVAMPLGTLVVTPLVGFLWFVTGRPGMSWKAWLVALLSGAVELAYHQNAMGGVAGPFDAWLTLRGLKTLAVRMERHCETAERVAAFLAARPEVTEVFYPGLPGHPGHDLAARQMRRRWRRCTMRWSRW